MDAKSANKSFMALSGSDSGLTLANSDSLARQNEQQQLEIKTQSKKIVELEDIVENLEDVIVKYKKQAKDLLAPQEQPVTSWMRDMVGENEELKAELRLKTTSIEDLTRKCARMAEELETASRQEENLLLKIEEAEYQKNLMSMDFVEQEQALTDFVEELMQEIEIKYKECETINEESSRMKNCINKICLLLPDREEEKVDHHKVKEDFENGFEDILKKVYVQVYKMAENDKMLRNDKQELCELVEFLENEEAIIIDDTENFKEAANELKVEKNALEIANKDLENKVVFWTQCCGKLYRWTKSEERMLEELEAKRKKVGKIANSEAAKRKKLVKKNMCLVKFLKASQAKARSEIELRNTLNAKNLDLEIDLQSFKEKLDSYENSCKLGILENFELVERNKDLESNVQFLESSLERNQTELKTVKSGWERMKVELEEEIKNKVMLEEKLSEVSAKKDKFEIDVKSRDNAIYDLQHEISELEDRVAKSHSPKLSCIQKFVRCSLG
eukprot:Seg2397.2 transcript_id=Seg2397.2/GoldUCD/mRNA.D3Y31 product="hypothetical protein" protein_id=Seg2397.2/GoldUCD/D3Y31